MDIWIAVLDVSGRLVSKNSLEINSNTTFKKPEDTSYTSIAAASGFKLISNR